MAELAATAIIGALGESGAALAVAGAVDSAIAFVGTYGLALAGVGYSLYEQQAAKAKAKSANASLGARTQSFRESVVPARMILGRAKVGGAISFVASTGPNLETLCMVIALASHECDAVEEVFFGDQKCVIEGHGFITNGSFYLGQNGTAPAEVGDPSGVTNVTAPPIEGSIYAVTSSGVILSAAITNVDENEVTVTPVPSEPYSIVYQYQGSKQTARIIRHLGGDGQVCDEIINGLLPTQWDASHIGYGIAYIAGIFTYDRNSFPNGLPEISAVVRGAKVFDPRTGLTAWSDNPALLMRHYATHPLGGRLPIDAIDDDQIAAAANVCDVTIDYSVTAAPDGSAEQTGDAAPGPIFRAGTLATSDQQPKDVLDQLAQAMAGRWAFVGNKLFVKAGSYVAPLMALNDDHFAGGSVQIQPNTAREQLFNIVTGTFSDPNNNWQATDVPRVIADAYVTEDGSELPLDVTWTAVPSAGQCQQLAAIKIRQAREAMTVVATFNMAAYPIQLFDTIALSNSRFGWDHKAFEVMGREWTLEGGIRLTLRETSATVYQQGEAFDTTYGSDNTLLPSPTSVQQVTGVSATSDIAILGDGTSQTRMRVIWDPVRDEAVIQGGRIEVQYVDVTMVPLDPAQNWAIWEEQGDLTEAIIPGLKSGTIYLVRVRARNGIGVTGPWSVQTLEQIAQPPSGGTTTYDQDTAPTTHNIGDLWTDGNNILYRWDGSSWVPVVDGNTTVAVVPDLTPPPTPTGFAGEAGISVLILHWNAATYTVGHGPGQTNIYGAKWPSGAAPTFSAAVRIASVAGPAQNITSIATDPATRWCLWLKFQTADGVESVAPAGGTNGLQLTTGQDPALLLSILTGQITSSQLYSSLGDRINLIDANFSVPGSVAYQVLQEANARAAALVTEANARVSGLSSLSTTLTNQITSLSGTLTTAINNEASSRASGDSTLSTNLNDNYYTNVETDQAIAERITTIESSLVSGFSAYITNDFEGVIGNLTADGWALTIQPHTLKIGAVTGDPKLYIGGVSNLGIAGGLYDKVRLQARVLSGTPTFDGGIYYANESHGYSGSYATSVGEPTGWASGAWCILEWDMTALSAGGNDWINSAAVSQIRIDIDSGLSPVQIEIDWISIGRHAPSVSDAKITQIQTTIASGDAANASLITALTTSVGTNTSAIATEQTARASADSALASSIATVVTNVAGNTAAITTEQTARSSADSALATSIASVVASAGSNTAAIVAEQTARANADSSLASSINTLSATIAASAGVALNADSACADLSAWSITGSVTEVTRTDGSSGTTAFAVNGQGIVASANLPMGAGRLIYASVRARKTAGTEGLIVRVHCYDNTATLLAYVLTPSRENVAVDSAWGIYDGTIQTPAGTNLIQLAITANFGASSGSITQLQDCRLEDHTALNAAIQVEATARTDADGALATSISTVAASAAANAAAITTEQTARSYADSSLASSITTLAATVTSGDATNAAGISAEQTARANADSALASSISTVATSAATNAASIVTEQTTRSNADSALSTSISTVAATTNAKTGGVLNLDPQCADLSQWTSIAGAIYGSSLTDGKSGTTSFVFNESASISSKLVQASVGQVLRASVWARKVSGVSGSFYMRILTTDSTGNTSAPITYDISVENVNLLDGAWHRLTGVMTIPAGAVWATLVMIGNYQGSGLTQIQDARLEDVTGYTAAIQTEATARANADGALSTLITTVQATANGASAAVATEATARAAADGSLFAQYTVKLDVNGYVSGYGLASTSGTATPTSSFIVRADKFAIAAPSGPGITPLVPFIVTTTATTENGVSIPAGVYIDAAFIVNLTAMYGKFSNLVATTVSTSQINAANMTLGDGTIGGNLKSSNYVANVSGWIERPDGTAEFQNIKARGDIQATSVTTNSITTTSINGEAVTSIRTVNATSIVFASTTQTVLTTVSVDPAGGKILIMFFAKTGDSETAHPPDDEGSGGAPTDFYPAVVKIYRTGGTLVGTANGSGTFIFDDSPSGAMSYYAQLQASSGTTADATIADRSITLFVAKR